MSIWWKWLKYRNCALTLVKPRATRRPWAYRRCLVMWLRVRFTCSHIYQCLVTEKKWFFLVGPTNFHCRATGLLKQHFAASRGDFSMNSAAIALFTWTFFFEKPVQLIDFTRTVHVNVNNNFFCFFKKLV
jgi:hypothetical protein